MLALSLRNDLLGMPPPPLPTSSSDLVASTPLVPDLLFNFLVWLMTGDNSTAPVGQEKIKDIPPEVHCRVMAIGQDIMFCASNGCIKQAKHICLPMTVRHVTGSRGVTREGHEGHAHPPPPPKKNKNVSTSVFRGRLERSLLPSAVY